MKTLKFIQFLFLFLFCSTLFGQNNPNSETKEIFKSFIKDKRQVFLNPSINNYYFAELYKYISENTFIRKITFIEINKTIIDTIIITKTERLYIDSCMNSFYSFKWTEIEKDKCGLERFSLIKNEDNKKLSDINYITYNLLKPIFIRQNSLCFLWYDYSCGSLCGHGELMILKKQENKWVKWKTIFHSDS